VFVEGDSYAILEREPQPGRDDGSKIPLDALDLASSFACGGRWNQEIDTDARRAIDHPPLSRLPTAFVRVRAEPRLPQSFG
jgi:hypothetical protein